MRVTQTHGTKLMLSVFIYLLRLDCKQINTVKNVCLGNICWDPVIVLVLSVHYGGKRLDLGRDLPAAVLDR